MKAPEGMRRLALAGTHFKKLSLEQVYRLVDPEVFQLEVEGAQARRLRLGFWRILRNCAALFPLIFTWFALYTASTNYQNDLGKYPNDLYEPFLKLWQYGFHNTTWFTFARAAIIDVGLLLLYLVLTVWVAYLEGLAQGKSRKFAKELQNVTEGLTDAAAAVSSSMVSDAGIDRIVQTIEKVSTEGVKKIVDAFEPIADADVQKIVNAIQRVVKDAFLVSEQVVTKAQKSMEDLFDKQIKVMIQQFHDDLATLNMDLTRLGSNLTQFGSDLQKYDQQLKALTDASTDLAKATSSLATNADSLTKSTLTYASVGQDINTQIGMLNGTQQKMVTEIETSQQQVVQQIVGVAGNMDTAAKSAEALADKLVLMAKQDVVQMTKSVSNAADRVADTADSLSLVNKQMQGSLSQVDVHLQDTTRQLETAAQALAAATSGGAIPKQKRNRRAQTPGSNQAQGQNQPAAKWWQFWKP